VFLCAHSAFRTADECVFAGGPVAKFSRRYASAVTNGQAASLGATNQAFVVGVSQR
jgi:hypothetical protein